MKVKAALHLQVEILDQAHIFGGIVALCVLYVEGLGGMGSAIASEGHEDALGLAALDGENDGLARGKEAVTGGTDGHIVGTVVGDDDRQLTLGSEQAGGTSGQFVEGQGVGVASHGACGIGALQGVLEERGIAEDGVEEEF